MKKCSIKLRDAPSSPVGLAEAQPWQPPWAEPRGARAPGRAGASSSITRASSRHPHRLPLGAQLKTGRLPRVRRGTHGPASGLKAGVQPSSPGTRVAAGQRALHPDGLQTCRPTWQKAACCWGDVKDAESRGCPG